MKEQEISIPVSIFDTSISKLTPVQFKKLMTAIFAINTDKDIPDDIDTSTGIILDMYSSFLDTKIRHRMSVSESRRSSAKSRWSKKQDNKSEDIQPQETNESQDQPLELFPVEEVIIEEVQKKPTPVRTPSFVPDNRFLETSPVKDAFLLWIDYRKKIRKSYNTQMSYEICHKHLMSYSGGDIEKAYLIVNDSIANGYAGIFPLKKNQYDTATKFERQERAEQQLISSVAQQCTDNIRAEQSSSRGEGEGRFVPKSI